MIDVLRVLSLPVTVLLIFVLFRLLTRGPHSIPQLSRSGFNLATWLTGKGIRDDAGSSIRTGHGLVMRIERDRYGNRKRVIVDETTNLSDGDL